MNKIQPVAPYEKVCIFIKGDRAACLGLKVTTGITRVAIFQDETVTGSVQQSPALGEQSFFNGIATSVDNGWSIGFLGTANNSTYS